MIHKRYRTTVLATCVAMMLPVLHAATFDRIPGGVSVDAGGTTIDLIFYTPSTVRVVKSPCGKRDNAESLSVTAQPVPVDFKVKEHGKRLELKSDSLTVLINTIDGSVSCLNHHGKTLMRESGNAVFAPVNDAGEESFKVSQSFLLDRDEPIYGFGNLENGTLSQRGLNRTLMPGNIEDGIPVLVSAKGYGIFWDNYSPTLFADNDGKATFESQVGKDVDYYFMSGANIDGVIAQMRTLSGDVPMFPLWTYGFWQSRERYKTQDEIVNVVNRYRKLGVPLDGIIQDWQYWGNNYLWNAMEFMNADFNNPQKMVDDIHAQNARMIISVWSSFGPATRPYRDLKDRNLLLDFETWPESGIAEQWPPRRDYPSGVRPYDCYSPEARDIYWNHLKRLYDFKIDGWWMDSTEPDHCNIKPADFDTPTSMGSFRKVRSAYPLLTVGGVYDHQRAETADKRVFILTRSGFFGQQRYGCNVWTGDVTSSWENLRKQIPAMLNFTMTGNPNTNSDIGGFFSGAYNTARVANSAVHNPQFIELYLRWMQFGAFTPMMRSHGTDIKREIYYFGDRGDLPFDVIEEAIKLRYSLLPYIYSTSHEVTATKGSFMRALVMDFPRDKNGWNCNDEYMFGRNILVAPIVEAHYTEERILKTDENTGWNSTETHVTDSIKPVDFLQPVDVEVYLPAGTLWRDFFTGQPYKGGRTITVASTIKSIPLYVKAGTVLPVGPDVQYAEEKPWNDLEVRVYPGADGTFTLYEDENDNYNYEKGMFSTIRFEWDDSQHRLTIGERSGSFPGMLQNRRFNVILRDGRENRPVTVDYDGHATTVTL